MPETQLALLIEFLEIEDMYNWRKMTDEQRRYILELRQRKRLPLHSLPHMVTAKDYFHISAACYEHKSIIGKSVRRMYDFEKYLFDIEEQQLEIVSYSILPNHYHLLIKTLDIKRTLQRLFKLHQKTGYYWNKEDMKKGRKVWFNVLDSGIKSEKHFWASINYIHNNPVKHGLVEKWQDWPFSSAVLFIKDQGYEKTLYLWKNHDISDMCKWDV